MRGKCWIYKRATLYIPGLKPNIIDYSDGTEPFDCNVVSTDDMGNPVYIWKLPNKTIIIPMNIKRNSIDSIVRTGVIKYQEGEIHYEYIFGKFKDYMTYYMETYGLVFLLLIFIMIYTIQLRFIKR
jgi:hypothetical protein